MKYNVRTTFLPAKNYLVIKGFIELDVGTSDSYEESERKLTELIKNGSIDRLREASGTKDVYTLFCHTCVLDEHTGAYICGYDIACENINNVQAGDGFDVVCLEPSEYAVFECSIEKEMTRVQVNKKIDDIYWGEWLKNNPYESMVETETGANTPGIAVIGLNEPLDSNAESFYIKIWYPIRQIE